MADWTAVMHGATSAVTLAIAVFLASAVEAVEALTIVVAVGVTRGWRSALEGLGLALVLLAALVAALGPALVRYVPLDVLRAVIGILLLNFGLQWLRKAVLRAVGLKAKHDEDLIMASTFRCTSRSIPAIPIADRRAPIVVGMRHTSSDTKMTTDTVPPAVCVASAE